MSAWRQALLESVLFSPLHEVIATLPTEVFPTLEVLNARLQGLDITVQSGHGLRFVAQEAGRLAFEQQYEPRCYLTGEVQTRADNWHDLLNALVWLTFPQAKAAINARHYHALTQSVATHAGRGALRDTATLLDESGVIVAYADAELAALLRDFRWHELFWQRRARVSSHMGFYLFGHGLFEKARHPYIGMTGQGMLLAVEPDFFGWPAAQQRVYLDRKLADYLQDPAHCRSTRELTPVPLLGVPGWSPDNESEAYYANTAYFRPGRSR